MHDLLNNITLTLNCNITTFSSFYSLSWVSFILSSCFMRLSHFQVLFIFLKFLVLSFHFFLVRLFNNFMYFSINFLFHFYLYSLYLLEFFFLSLFSSAFCKFEPAIGHGHLVQMIYHSRASNTVINFLIFCAFF